MKRKFRKKIYVRLVMQDNMCFKCWKSTAQHTGHALNQHFVLNHTKNLKEDGK